MNPFHSEPSQHMTTAVPAAEFEKRLLLGEIAPLRKRVNPRRLRRYVQELAALPSRHIDHSGNGYAVDLLYDEFQQINPDLEREKRPFPYRDGKLYNLEATLAGKGKIAHEVVIISAHLDSTAAGDPAYQPRIDPAPGADDDASGVAAVLMAARVITRLVKKIAHSKRRAIRFALFNAEEAEQAGSRAYVDKHAAGVVAVFQMDMIGYPSRGNLFEIHAGYREVISESAQVQTPSLELAECVRRLAPVVAPGLLPEVYPVGENPDPAQGFSDHTSFHRKKIPACLISENFFAAPGGEGLDEPNPCHHLPQDSAGKLDYAYAADIARAVAAAAWFRATREGLPELQDADARRAASMDSAECTEHCRTSPETDSAHPPT